MARRNFADILKEADVDICREYGRLFNLFYIEYVKLGPTTRTLKDYCDIYFRDIPFVRRCISLKDFDETYGFNFVESPSNIDIDLLVSFCEYSLNLLSPIVNNFLIVCSEVADLGRKYINQVFNVIDSIGYMSTFNKDVGVTIFVPQNAPAITVAETLPKDLSYKVIEYNHHSLKGNLKGKADILRDLADQLEPRENDLKKIDEQFKKDLFYLLNNINIRHNNEDKISNINEKELEEWYDYTYDMSLLAFMMLEKKNHKNEILELKKKLGDIKEG